MLLIDNQPIDYAFLENYMLSTLNTHFANYVEDKIDNIDNVDRSVSFLKEATSLFEDLDKAPKEHRFLFNYLLLRTSGGKSDIKIDDIESKFITKVTNIFCRNFYVFTITLRRRSQNLIMSSCFLRQEPTTKSNLPSFSFDKHIREIAFCKNSDSVSTYQNFLEMGCEEFESEVIENFLFLDQEDRRFYWSKLQNDLIRLKPYAPTDTISFNEIIDKFNVINLEAEMNTDSAFSEILNNSKDEYLKIEGNLGREEFHRIHDICICYYQNKYYDLAKIFIDAQYFDQTLAIEQITSLPPIPHKKLKVNITVPQLTFLFKLLNDLKPEIFDIASKKELSNFIADNFITKATEKEGIKEGSVYNQLTNTEKCTAIFWSEKLSKMIQEARHV